MKYLISLFLLGSASLCFAQTPQDSSKASYSIFHPTPKKLMRALSTDRPDATESPYTLDAGHFQYETDLFKVNRIKINNTKVVKNSFNVANFKLGITNSLDLQFIIASFVSEKIINNDFIEKNYGVGSISIRAKQNIWGNDKAKTALAILPFVNIPSIESNEKISGGLIIPFSISLSNNWNLGTQLESDIIQNKKGNGYHFNYLTSATTSHSLFNKCDFFLEGVISRDNKVKNYEYFANTGLVYKLKENVTLDTGIYYGIKNISSKSYFIGLSFRL